MRQIIRKNAKLGHISRCMESLCKVDSRTRDYLPKSMKRTVGRIPIPRRHDLLWYWHSVDERSDGPLRWQLIQRRSVGCRRFFEWIRVRGGRWRWVHAGGVKVRWQRRHVRDPGRTPIINPANATLSLIIQRAHEYSAWVTSRRRPCRNIDRFLLIPRGLHRPQRSYSIGGHVDVAVEQFDNAGDNVLYIGIRLPLTWRGGLQDRRRRVLAIDPGDLLTASSLQIRHRRMLRS